MIRQGRVVFIGDEVIEAIALASGLDAYVLKDCTSLREWIDKSIDMYDVVVYLDTVKHSCRDVVEYMERKWSNKVYLVLDHPLTGVQRDPREYYKEIARRTLGIEIVLED